METSRVYCAKRRDHKYRLLSDQSTHTIEIYTRLYPPVYYLFNNLFLYLFYGWNVLLMYCKYSCRTCLDSKCPLFWSRQHCSVRTLNLSLEYNIVQASPVLWSRNSWWFPSLSVERDFRTLSPRYSVLWGFSTPTLFILPWPMIHPTALFTRFKFSMEWRIGSAIEMVISVHNMYSGLLLGRHVRTVAGWQYMLCSSWF